MQGLLLDPVHMRGRGDAGDLEHGRRDVDHVREVAPHGARVGDRLRVVDHERVARAPEVGGDLLAPVEGAVARPRPGGRVVRGDEVAAPGLEAAVLEQEAHLLLGGERDPVQRRHLVEGAREGALHAGAVVAPDPDHEGVVELAHLLDRVEDAADVPVGVLRVAGVGLHLTRVQTPLGLAQRVPRRERVVLGQLGVRRGRRRAPSGARASPRGRRPSPGRTCPCTCRPTPAARGAARGCSRSSST